MSAHVIAVSVGPVQEFIAQARRTRDLWYGSHLLSELSKAAARPLAARGALVFPALARGDRRLEPTDEPVDQQGRPAFSVANRILVELPDGADPAEAAREARDGALGHLRRLAQAAKGRCQGVLAQGIEAAWSEQVESFLEFTAAWAPITVAGGYVEARRAAESLLAARKVLREFAGWKAQRGGVPKSSLDGGRETLLAPPEGRDVSRGPGRTYRIGLGEQLDAIGILKRAGGKPEHFAPISNVAAGPWLLRQRDNLAALVSAAREAGLPEIGRPWPWVRAFPLDAQLVRSSQHKALVAEGLVTQEWLDENVSPVSKDIGEPPSYVVCLVADGDHMGRALDSFDEADRHRAFSQGLAEFAGEARRIVEEEHDGVLVYAGGDDVLAFLSVERALACAAAIESAFRSSLQARYPAGQTPSISVGLGVGHVLENMADLLRLGRAAERLAKGTRNSLGIVFSKRSGGDIEWSAPWTQKPDQLIHDAQLALTEGRVSAGKIYEVADLLRRVRTLDQQALGRVLAADAWRTLSRSEGRAGAPQSPKDIGLELSGVSGPATYTAVDEWCRRFRIALQLRQGA